MKLQNIMPDVRQLLIRGQVFYVQPGEIIEGEKIQYDSGSFITVLEEKNTDLNLVKKNKLKKEKAK